VKGFERYRFGIGFILALLLVFAGTASSADPSPMCKQLRIGAYTYSSSVIWQNDYLRDWYANRYAFNIGSSNASDIAAMKSINPELKSLSYVLFVLPAADTTDVKAWADTTAGVDFEDLIIRAKTGAGNELTCRLYDYTTSGFGRWVTTQPGQVMIHAGFTDAQTRFAWDFREPKVGDYLAQYWIKEIESLGIDGVFVDEETISGYTGVASAGLYPIHAPFKNLSTSYWTAGGPYDFQRPWSTDMDYMEIRDSLNRARNGWMKRAGDALKNAGYMYAPNFAAAVKQSNLANWNSEVRHATVLSGSIAWGEYCFNYPGYSERFCNMTVKACETVRDSSLNFFVGWIRMGQYDQAEGVPFDRSRMSGLGMMLDCLYPGSTTYYFSPCTNNGQVDFYMNKTLAGVTADDTTTMWDYAWTKYYGEPLVTRDTTQKGTDPAGQSYTVHKIAFHRSATDHDTLTYAIGRYFRDDQSNNNIAATAVSVTLPQSPTNQWFELNSGGGWSLYSSSTATVGNNHWRIFSSDTMLSNNGLVLSPCEYPPSGVNGISPANGLIVSTTPTLCASNAATGDCSDPVTYQFEISENASFTSVVRQSAWLDEGSGSTCFTTTAPLDRGRTYYWRVRATNGTATGGWSAVRNFTTPDINTPPTRPQVYSPPNGATLTFTPIALTWFNSVDTDGDALVYQVRLYDSTGSTMLDNAVDIPAGVGSITSYMPGISFINGTWYRWRVQAYDGEDSSAAMTDAFFYYNTAGPGNTPPPMPSGIAPVNAGTVDNTTPYLIVSNVVDPDGTAVVYYFQVSTSSNFSVLAAQSGATAPGAENTPWQVSTPLNNSTTYYWRARSFDGLDYSDWTAPMSFTVNTSETNDPPTVPVVYSPPDGATVTFMPVALTWYNSLDTDGDQLFYRVELYDENGTTLLDSASGISQGTGLTTSYSFTYTFENDTWYTWRVLAFDGAAYSSWMSPVTFHLDTTGLSNNPPPTPTGLSPTNDDVVDNTRPYLIVNNVDDPDGTPVVYYFQVSRFPNFSSIAAESNAISPGVNNTSWQINSVLSNGMVYYWRARAFDGLDYSGWSVALRFTVNTSQTNTIPTTPTVYSPPNSATVTFIPVSMTWHNSTDADSDPLIYELQLFDSAGVTILDSASGISQGSGSTTSYALGYDFENNEWYRWRARAFDGTDFSAWMATATFHIDTVGATNNPPPAPTPVSPANGSEVSSAHPTLTIGNVTDPDGTPVVYYFQVSKFSNFSSLAAQSGAMTPGASNTSWQVTTALENGSGYFWRAVAFDGIAYSPWSSTPSFTVNTAIGNEVPTTPTVYSPPNGATITYMPVSVAWYNSTDANGDLLTYDVQLLDMAGTNVLDSAIGISQSTGATTSYAFAFDFDNQMWYRWRTRANDGSEYSEWMTSAAFYLDTLYGLNQPPEAPGLDTPGDMDTLTTLQVSLVTNPSFDPEGDNLTYQFMLYADSAHTTVVDSVSGITPGSPGSVITWPISSTLSSGAVYFWTCRANDGSNYSEWADDHCFWAFDFSVNTDQEAPDPMYPPDGMEIEKTKPTLEVYNVVSNEPENLYHFEVSEDSTFVQRIYSGPVEEDHSGKTGWQIPVPLESGKEYFWRCRANNSPYNKTATFVVDANVFIGPNPFEPAKGHDQVTIFNMAEDGVLTITNLNNEVIRVIKGNSLGTVTWDVTNNDGQQLATDVYLCYYQDSDKTVTFKFAVIR